VTEDDSGLRLFIMNENLLFNVAQLLREPVGSSRSGRIVADLRRIAPDLVRGESDLEAEVSGEVRLASTQVGVLVQGDLRGSAPMACVRCLEPVQTPLAFRIEETFVPTVDILTGRPLDVEEEDRALWIDEHHVLDLEEVVRQEAILAAPLHVLCRTECRGLCPTCGQNLNEGPCDCRPEPDPRWSALLDLLQQ
jgi:uncharacterized protein